MSKTHCLGYRPIFVAFSFRFTPGNVSKHPITVPWMLACLDVSGGHIPLLKNQSQQVGAVCLWSLSAATRHRVLYTINRCFHWGVCLTNTLSLFVSSAAIGLLFLPETILIKDGLWNKKNLLYRQVVNTIELL